MILGDTHALVWYLDANRNLGPEARDRIARAIRNGQAAFSAISMWEIGMLQQKGRLDSDLNAEEWRDRLLTEGFHEISVDGAIAARASGLEDIHGDPADRIIVATALEGHLLITRDRPILNWRHELDRFDAGR